MELLVAAIVVVVIALAAFALWQRRRLGNVKDKAELYNRYMDLRQAVVSKDPSVSTEDFTRRADASVANLGPLFDPRVSAWKRLDLIEPKLRAFVTSGIDAAVEDPADLEIFAEGILFIELGGFRGITPPEWFQAAKDFVGNAAAYRTLPPPAGKGMNDDTAFAEATAVGRRYFGAFGGRSWDRARAMAVD